jgi:hypothetical protein
LKHLQIPDSTKAHVVQHIKTKRHVEQVKIKDDGHLRQQKIVEMGKDSRSEYLSDLCKMALSANIPFTKLNNPRVEDFLKKHCHQRPVDRTTLTKTYLPLCYDTVRKVYRFPLSFNEQF